MNLNKQFGSFKRTKWETTNQTKLKNQLTTHYQTLGYQVPKYIEKGNITNKLLKGALNKIESGYNKRTEQKETRQSLQNILDIEVSKLNKKMDNLGKYLQDYGLVTEKELSYIKGEPLTVSASKVAHIKDKLSLEHEGEIINKTKKDIKNSIERIKKKSKEYTRANYLKRLFDKTKNNKDFKTLITSDQPFDELGEGALQLARDKFAQLSAIQQEIVIKSRLAEIREKYKEVWDNMPPHLQNHVMELMLSAMDSIEKEMS